MEIDKQPVNENGESIDAHITFCRGLKGPFTKLFLANLKIFALCLRGLHFYTLKGTE